MLPSLEPQSSSAPPPPEQPQLPGPVFGCGAFWLLFEQIADPAWVADAGGRIRAVNPCALNCYGYTRSEFLTLTQERLWAANVPVTQALLPSPRARHRTKQGQPLDVEVTAAPVEVDGEPLTLFVARGLESPTPAAEKSARDRQLYATLSQVNQAILRIKDRRTLLASICRVVVEESHFPLAFVAEVDPATGDVLPTASAGRAVNYIANFHLNVNRPETMAGPTGLTLRTGQLTVSQDTANDPKMIPWRDAALAHGLRSSAAIPFREQGQVVGTFNFYADQPGFFTADEQHLLRSIGDDLSFALDAMRTEAESRISRELFRQIFHSSPIAKSLVRQRDSQYMDVNVAFERMAGRTRDQLLGKTWAQLNLWVNPNLRQMVFAQLMQTASIQDVDIEFYTGSGEIRRGLLYAELVDDLDEKYILASMVDVTDQKQVEASLTRAQQTQRIQISALEAAADAIVITARSGSIEWVNPAFTKLTGYGLDEVVGRNMRDLLKSGRQDPAFYAELWGTITTGDVWRGELINRRKNGTLYVEEQTITPVRADEDGEITHFVAIKRDISHQQEMENQARRQERLAAVGQLAAGIAHDFNNIMAVIMLYAQTTARSTALSDRDRERLSSIHEQVQHGAHMIRQILDFSRQTDMDRHPLDFQTLLKEQVKMLQRTLPENIAVLLAAEPDEYIISADPTRMQQVIMNLAVNARDAMPNGGSLTFQLRRLQVRADAPPLPGMSAGAWIALGVIDTGTGMPPEVLARIFEPFFTTKAPGAGTGLGLSQVHGIVEEHGGQLGVTSQVGEGSTFTLYLPALQIARPANAMPELGEFPHGHGEMVLVIEDNRLVRSALVEMLDLFGYRTLEAEDGRAGLTLLAATQEQIDVVLTDLVMPHMGGVEFVRALRQQGYTMPVIPMTGHPLGSDLDGLRTMGVMETMMKPVTPAQLARALATALRAAP